jgi:predicted dehydrogenase
MKAQKVNIGLVGVANHGRTIYDAIRVSANLNLVSCYDTDEKAREETARESGARIASSYDDLVGDPAIDAVALVTPNHLHAEQAMKAAAAGKHVFVEKPISNSIAGAKDIIAALRFAGLVLMVGHNTRRRGVFRRAKEILQEGRIGTIVAIEGNLSRPAGLQPGLPLWKADPMKCPLLPMTQLGIHLIDTVEYLIGHVERVSCFAAHVAMPGNVYDSTAAILQLESGIPFALTSYYVSPDAYFLRIYGTGGLLHCYPTILRLELTRSGGAMNVIDEDFPQELAGSYNLQMQEFGDCILNRRKPETGGDEGLRALAVIEAMNRSVASSSVVNIRDIME